MRLSASLFNQKSVEMENDRLASKEHMRSIFDIMNQNQINLNVQHFNDDLLNAENDKSVDQINQMAKS